LVTEVTLARDSYPVLSISQIPIWRITNKADKNLPYRRHGIGIPRQGMFSGLPNADHRVPMGLASIPVFLPA